MAKLDPRRWDFNPPKWMSQLSWKLLSRGRSRLDADQVIDAQRKLLDKCQRRWGIDSRPAITAMEHLSEALRKAGRLDEALILQKGVLTRRRQHQGRTESWMLGSEFRLGATLAEAKRYDEAEPVLIRVTEAEPEDDDGQVIRLRAMGWLGYTQRQLGQYALAQEVLERAVAGHRERVGDEGAETLRATFDLAGVLASGGNLQESLPLQRQVLESLIRTLGPEDPTTVRAMTHLATWMHRAGENAEARVVAMNLLPIRRRLTGNDAANTEATIALLAKIDRAIADS